MYSRSLTKDYRWIFSDYCLTQKERREILNDYREFENNRALFLNDNHLIIRGFEKSIAFYSFSDTKKTDEYSRQIYALTGLVFSNDDMEFVLALKPIISASLYYSPNYLDLDNRDYSDDFKDVILPVELSLDQFICLYKTNDDIKRLANLIKAELERNPFDAFLLRDRTMEPIVTETYSSSSISQSGLELDDMLNSKMDQGNDKTPITPPDFGSGKRNLIKEIYNIFRKDRDIKEIDRE